jgi:hypothetical protein
MPGIITIRIIWHEIWEGRSIAVIRILNAKGGKVIMAVLKVTKIDLTSNIQEYLWRVETKGEELIVTSGEESIFIIKPYKSKQTADAVFGPFRGKVDYAGNLLDQETGEWLET